MIRGCVCSRAMSVDNQYDQSYVNQLPWLYQHLYNSTFVTTDFREIYYRGPNAYAATDFAGYNCAQAQCPHGDDPLTGPDVNEIQRISCAASSGTFHLKFRENITLPIRYNDTVKTMKLRLEQLFTIGSVAVYPNTTLHVCNSSEPIYVEFLTEYGDLPMMKADLTYLYYSNFSIAEYQKGAMHALSIHQITYCFEFTISCNTTLYVSTIVTLHPCISTHPPIHLLPHYLFFRYQRRR